MISTIFLFLVVLSGSLLTYTFGNKKLASTIPVTIMSLVLILYSFGLLGILRTGVIVVDILVLLIYLYFFLLCFFRKISLRVFLNEEMWTIISFGIVYGILVYATRGALASNWDEFSHWADVVKVMTLIDDFSTAPNSPSLFKSYPPAMALFQYFVQKNNMIFLDNGFVEWRLYLAYQVFAVSLLFTISDKRVNLTNKLSEAFIILCVIPIFYSKVFLYLLIDAFVALLAAYGMIVFLCKQRDLLYMVEIPLICFTLVLSKDVGIYFAIIIAAFYALDYLFDKQNIYKKYSIGLSIIPLISILFAKCTWNYEIRVNNIQAAFSQRINVAEYLNMLIFHNGTDYRQDVVNKSFAAFLGRGNHGVVILGKQCSFLLLLIILCAVLIYSNICLYREKAISKHMLLITSIFLPIMVLGYALFIGAMYAFRFSEYEAMNLASYERYMNMPYTCLMLVSIVAFIRQFEEKYIGSLKFKDSLVIICIFVALIGDAGAAEKYIQREPTLQSQKYRQDFDLLIDGLNNNCTTNDKIYFLSYSDDGKHILTVQYAIRPISFSNKNWYITAPGTMNEIYNSMYAVEKTPDEFMEELIDEEYDYVAIHWVGAKFKQDFAECFENIDEVEDDFVYYVDKNKRKLVLCK